MGRRDSDFSTLSTSYTGTHDDASLSHLGSGSGSIAGSYLHRMTQTQGSGGRFSSSGPSGPSGSWASQPILSSSSRGVRGRDGVGMGVGFGFGSATGSSLEGGAAGRARWLEEELSAWERRMRHDEIRRFKSRGFAYVVQEDPNGFGAPLHSSDGGGLVGLKRSRKDDELVGVVGKNALKILRIIPPSPSSPPTRSQSKHTKDPAPPPPSPPISRSWRLGPSSFEDKKIRSPSPSPEGLGGFGLGEEKQQYRVKEEWDVRGAVSDGGGNAEKVGKAYVATGLDWGFNHSSEDLAMACTNGAIVVWQLQPSGVVLDQVKFEHTKAINKVVFGGEQGHWLISGSQDGYLKLWDIREGRPSRMILNSLSDPVRDLALSPVPGEVYAIASVHDSGSLVRWDLRKPGMNYSSIAQSRGSIGSPLEVRIGRSRYGTLPFSIDRNHCRRSKLLIPSAASPSVPHMFARSLR
ncbi:hypothetical protein BT69DRAFT_708177 [Atractiella rhizophila]|nr:hypothetical protein BT69DRAFT_708177 [Atractiella rhizophila]